MLRQRMYRMRAWRQSLTAAEAREWVCSGAAGPALRSFNGVDPHWWLEERLVRSQPQGKAESQGWAS